MQSVSDMPDNHFMKLQSLYANELQICSLTRCRASSQTRRGRWVEAVDSHSGGSSARANGFQSSRITRCALRFANCDEDVA